MDFNPDHPKWICCCCHLASGLMILASTEIVISVLLLSYTAAVYIANMDEKVNQFQMNDLSKGQRTNAMMLNDTFSRNTYLKE